VVLKLGARQSEIAQMAKEARVKRLMLTHFRVHMDSPENHAAALESLHRTFGPAATIAEDLDVITV
jgi:ribonuclease BN (tRNA processing enzyme)